MPYTKVAKPKGSKVSYQLGSNAKKYTFRDLGFRETQQGNFRLERDLDPTPQIKSGVKLKITVNKSLDGLKMSIVTSDGMKEVDIFANNDETGKMIQEKYQFVMNALVQRNCLEEIK